MITKAFRIPQAQAAELPPRLRGVASQDTSKRAQDTTKKKTQDTTKKAQDTAKKVQDTAKKIPDSTKKIPDSTKKAQDTANKVQDTANAPIMSVPIPTVANPAGVNSSTVNPVPPGGAAVPNAAVPVPAPPIATPPVTATAVPGVTPSVPGASPMAGKTAERLTVSPELKDAGMRIVEAKNREARFGIEIQKKFSLAAACIVFVLIGAPLAVRFPRGGVGLVIGASFFVFAVYYIALTSGESLANRNIISPFWAMWADNIIFLAVGIPLIIRMGTERVTSRGGGLSEKIDGVRLWFARHRAGAGTKTGGHA
jgi:lipopolysaccharide export system permease protein